jgi:hypothetical protein
MNLTITQAIERTKDLSGELKAARTAKADCAADVEAKDRMAEIARKALTNAEDHEARLMVEREELADHIAALVRLTGDPPPLAIEDGPTPEMIVHCPNHGRAISNSASSATGYICEECDQPYELQVPAFNSVFTEGADFQAQALENGLARIHDAFERST